MRVAIFQVFTGVRRVEKSLLNPLQNILILIVIRQKGTIPDKLAQHRYRHRLGMIVHHD